jgi:DNA-binding response OmpR family regulator
VGKTVLIIEGNRADSPNFVPAIRKKDYRVEVVRSGKEALRSTSDINPDIIVVNAASLRTNGKRICSKLRSELGDCPIIVIHSEDVRYNGDLDANVVLVLPFTARKLINRIRALVPTKIDKTLKAGSISLDLDRNVVQCGSRQTQLTPKLAQLMEAFLRHPGELLNREDLFSSVWQTKYLADTRTLDVHISWLRQAIEEDPRKPQYIKTVRGVGYRLDPS